jgi:hypothetical protein
VGRCGFGDEEPGEKNFDVRGGDELRELGEEFGGEIVGVGLRGWRAGITETKTGVGVQNRKTALAAIGGVVAATGAVVKLGVFAWRFILYSSIQSEMGGYTPPLRWKECARRRKKRNGIKIGSALRRGTRATGGVAGMGSRFHDVR